MPDLGGQHAEGRPVEALGDGQADQQAERQQPGRSEHHPQAGAPRICAGPTMLPSCHGPTLGMLGCVDA